MFLTEYLPVLIASALNDHGLAGELKTGDMIH